MHRPAWGTQSILSLWEKCEIFSTLFHKISSHFLGQRSELLSHWRKCWRCGLCDQLMLKSVKCRNHVVRIGKRLSTSSIIGCLTMMTPNKIRKSARLAFFCCQQKPAGLLHHVNSQWFLIQHLQPWLDADWCQSRGYVWRVMESVQRWTGTFSLCFFCHDGYFLIPSRLSAEFTALDSKKTVSFIALSVPTHWRPISITDSETRRLLHCFQ